jgi:type I restriction enzyme S subunit
VQSGDVLMNEGGDYDKLGRGTVWRGQISPCLHQNHVFRVRANQAKLLPDFLALVSASPYGKRFFVLSSKQSTNLASINSTQLKAFPVPLPPATEQQGITEVLGAAEIVLETEGTQLAKLQRLKAGLMQDLLSGRVSVAGLRGQETCA